MADLMLNGNPVNIAKTTPNALQRLDDADELLRDYNKENDKNYLFDPDFRGKYLKAVADVVIEFEDDNFNPGQDFYSDGDFEVSTLQEARSVFLARGGMIGNSL